MGKGGYARCRRFGRVGGDGEPRAAEAIACRFTCDRLHPRGCRLTEDARELHRGRLSNRLTIDQLAFGVLSSRCTGIGGELGVSPAVVVGIESIE